MIVLLLLASLLSSGIVRGSLNCTLNTPDFHKVKSGVLGSTYEHFTLCFLKSSFFPYFEDSQQNKANCLYFSSEIPTLFLPELLLLGGGPDMSRSPQMIRDQDVGGHGDPQRGQELHQEHHQGHPGPTGCRQHELKWKINQMILITAQLWAGLDLNLGHRLDKPGIDGEWCR